MVVMLWLLWLLEELIFANPNENHPLVWQFCPELAFKVNQIL